MEINYSVQSILLIVSRTEFSIVKSLRPQYYRIIQTFSSFIFFLLQARNHIVVDWNHIIVDRGKFKHEIWSCINIREKLSFFQVLRLMAKNNLYSFSFFQFSFNSYFNVISLLWLSSELWYKLITKPVDFSFKESNNRSDFFVKSFSWKKTLKYYVWWESQYLKVHWM